jgi:hypothetical protein
VCAKDAYVVAFLEILVDSINGTLTLLEQFMIVRWISWMSLPCSSGCCIKLELDGKFKTSCGGSHPKDGCLLVNLSIVSWVVMMSFVLHGRVFG